MPSDASPTPPDPERLPTGDAHAGEPPVGEPLPPLLPFHTPPAEERPLPRGCHPLVFGVVLATLQFAATCYFMPSCFHAPG